ncbi:MAG: hypothetical protein COS95_03590 [Ignavibacteriales bacterium CG07_land_8_20_14_0_80_59_12]|nr:MAG: hypothetical protein COS95_03590 [Ignavibacteriales bacterium CG07_land_8_20_14_0_80_59_12]
MRSALAAFVGSVLILSFALFSASCRKNSQLVAPPDTAHFLTKQQHEISWPGLANSPWPMFLHDAQHTGRSPYRGPQEGKVEWTFFAGGGVFSSPVIDENGTIYVRVSSFSPDFLAIGADGQLKWSKSTAGDGSALVAADGNVHVDGYDNWQRYLFAYDRGGFLKWRFPVVGNASFSSPVISKDGGTVYLAVGSLYAIRRDGTLHWKWKPDSDSVQYSPAMSPDGTLLYVPGGHALYAVDTSGHLRLTCRKVPSAPAVDNDGNVYFCAGADELCSFDQSGVLRWRLPGVPWTGLGIGPIIGWDGTIYVITCLDLYAIDYAGRLKWKYPLPALSDCIPAIDVDGTIYFGLTHSRRPYGNPADSTNFIALNPDGTMKFQMYLAGGLGGWIPNIDSPPAISGNGRIYVSSNNPGHHVYAIK